jgi:shikimate kinase
MNRPRRSVVLLGMPGAGKSTLGVQLAKELALDFIDTDVLIQVREGRSLQDILDASDYLTLRHLEEQVLLEIDPPRHVIATGGSAIYSEAGMRHLKSYGPAVFLDVELDELERRIHNYESRGIAMRRGQSFADLFAERRSLYQRHADLTLNCNGKNQRTVVAELIAQVSGTGQSPLEPGESSRNR